MVSREDIENFLDRLTAEGVTYTEVEPGLWRVRPGGALDFDLVVTYAPPVVVLRTKVMDLPSDERAHALARRLLELNATDLLHGAYGIERESVVLGEALELAHLDYEEFQASYESMTLALASHLRELASICDYQFHTDTHRVVAATTRAAAPASDALHEAR
jgi:hypothetical protein